MSYKVLARKWRPQHFRDMIGQDHVLRALTNALDTQRLHHAYLFTGMRGVGKTTIARILAKCLNCETNGVSSSPCGECSVCKDIEAGRFFDLIEVDAASRTKVDETRELLENVPYAPTSGRYKIYLIDEVHMFSTHSFNALLKTLEEPPEHVKFLLATTDPQKVPVTVLSRCLQFNLKRVPPTRLAAYLSEILQSEDIPHDHSALELIAKAADGSVRDSLSLVEQAAAFGLGAVKGVEVEAMLGRVSSDRLISLLVALFDADAEVLFALIDDLAEYAPDYAQIMGELLSLLHRVAVLQSLPSAAQAESSSGSERLLALAAKASAEAVQLYYQIALHARRDMPFSPDQREAFDMALLRMMAFAPQGQAAIISSNHAEAPVVAAPMLAQSTSSVAQSSAASQPAGAPALGMSGREAALLAAKGGVPPSVASVVAPPAQRAAPPVATAAASSSAAVLASAAPSKPVADSPQVTPVSSSATDAPKPAVTEVSANNGVVSPDNTNHSTGSAQAGSAVQASQPAVQVNEALSVNSSPSEPLNESQPASPPSNATVLQAASTDGPNTNNRAPQVSRANNTQVSAPVAADLASLNTNNWSATVQAIGLSGMPRQLANNCIWHSCVGNQVTLHLEAASEHLNTPRFAARVQELLKDYTQADIQLDVVVVPGELATPARLEVAEQQQAMQAAHAAINDDPFVKQLVNEVDGVVDQKSVQPSQPNNNT